MSFDEKKSIFNSDKKLQNTTLILKEMIEKLEFSGKHLEVVEHACIDCLGVQNIQWCITHLNDLSTLESIKQLQLENEENNFEELLEEDEKITDEVAQYISNNYKRRKNALVMKKIKPTEESKDRYNHPRQSLRLQGEFIELRSHTGSVPSLMSETNQPKKSYLWLMEMLDEWSCDIFKVADFTAKPLTMITYAIMKKRNLLKIFNIGNKNMVSFMYDVETKYNRDLTYHNSVHAADVLQTMHYLLLATPLADALSDLEILCLLIACAIHDVDHPGFDNQYLVKVKSHLATLYNDASVLENHHLATAFKIIYDKKDNILAQFSEDEADYFRNLVIKLVLATDSTYHVSVTSAFQICVDKCLVGGELVFDKDESRIDLMRGLVHFADISNPTKSLDVYENWTKRIMEEFFHQGDLERKANMTVSPLCDRYKTDIGKAQIGFIDYIVRPMCEILIKVLSSDEDENDRSKKMHNYLVDNYDYFKYKYQSDSIKEMINNEKGFKELRKEEKHINEEEELLNIEDEILSAFEDTENQLHEALLGNFSENNRVLQYNMPKRLNKVHYLNMTKAIEFRTPYFLKTANQSCLGWNRDISDEECD